MQEIENALECEDVNVIISSIFLLPSIIFCYNTFTKHKTNKRERQLFSENRKSLGKMKKDYSSYSYFDVFIS